ncbi:MAG TPA: FkbM family methyltransferase [Pyrinomonadaceae bacterium]|nr:FkbM family methyltransferase [Pyrinomonadaceae bacterium]
MPSLQSFKNWHSTVISAKNYWYGRRGEPITYGQHRLRYIPGTRPVRLKYVDSTDLVVRNDARQLQFFVERVKPGNFVMDIGGNAGQYAVLFSSLVGPSGKVISFEPDPAHRSVLIKNLELNRFASRALVEEFALSDLNGSHSFYSRNDQMSSLVKSGLGTNAGLTDVREYKVKTTRLDDYLSRGKLGFPDWVKVDTEGAEINVLRGAGELLKSKAVIVCELHPYAWNEFQTSFDELLSIVRGSQRKIRYLDAAFDIESGPLHSTVIISKSE